MTGEEMSGPPGPKVLRLLYFVGAGFICTAAINKWRELERKSLQKKQQESNLLTDDAANSVQKVVK
ncbi:uncharacterized protein LOC123201610 [Mangifera indica]|uniref:uncharacterized protein LOC123201610 n=1 Tax=Mangifera indica TaxID=29780 RepID=UPI001CFC2E31|nr:uncharacterized protein LOC123201610 [Mangifera indica]XP_044473120.1 uncharacterized protein LOC123201610 [Mangifera indica]